MPLGGHKLLGTSIVAIDIFNLNLAQWLSIPNRYTADLQIV